MSAHKQGKSPASVGASKCRYSEVPFGSLWEIGFDRVHRGPAELIEAKPSQMRTAKITKLYYDQTLSSYSQSAPRYATSKRRLPRKNPTAPRRLYQIHHAIHLWDHQNKDFHLPDQQNIHIPLAQARKHVVRVIKTGLHHFWRFSISPKIVIRH